MFICSDRFTNVTDGQTHTHMHTDRQTDRQTDRHCMMAQAALA